MKYKFQSSEPICRPLGFASEDLTNVKKYKSQKVIAKSNIKSLWALPKFYLSQNRFRKSSTGITRTMFVLARDLFVAWGVLMFGGLEKPKFSHILLCLNIWHAVLNTFDHIYKLFNNSTINKSDLRGTLLKRRGIKPARESSYVKQLVQNPFPFRPILGRPSGWVACQLAGWLAGWLAATLAGWLGWLAGCLGAWGPAGPGRLVGLRCGWPLVLPPSRLRISLPWVLYTPYHLRCGFRRIMVTLIHVFELLQNMLDDGWTHALRPPSRIACCKAGFPIVYKVGNEKVFYTVGVDRVSRFYLMALLSAVQLKLDVVDAQNNKTIYRRAIANNKYAKAHDREGPKLAVCGWVGVCVCGSVPGGGRDPWTWTL